MNTQRDLVSWTGSCRNSTRKAYDIKKEKSVRLSGKRKKIVFKQNNISESELETIKEHGKIIDAKSKIITERYRKGWDTDKGMWKKGYE